MNVDNERGSWILLNTRYVGKYVIINFIFKYVKAQIESFLRRIFSINFYVILPCLLKQFRNDTL